MSTEVQKLDAAALDEEVQRLATMVGRYWVRLGFACQRMRDERLWEHLGFASFDAWIGARLAESRATVYSTLRTLKALNGVAPEAVAEMTRSNAQTLAKLPESKRLPEVIEQAKAMGAPEFRAVVERQLTPLERDEARRTVAFNVPVSVAEVIELAVARAKSAAETDSRAEAIEMICAEFVSGHMEGPDQ